MFTVMRRIGAVAGLDRHITAAEDRHGVVGRRINNSPILGRNRLASLSIACRCSSVAVPFEACVESSLKRVRMSLSDETASSATLKKLMPSLACAPLEHRRVLTCGAWRTWLIRRDRPMLY